MADRRNPVTIEEYLWAAFIVGILTVVAAVVVGVDVGPVFGWVVAGVGGLLASVLLLVGLIGKGVELGVRGHDETAPATRR